MFLGAADSHILSQQPPWLILESEPASIWKHRSRTTVEAPEIKALMMPLHNAGSAG